MSITPRGFRILAIAYAILVITVSSWPGVRLPKIGGGSIDKLLHFGQYAILAYLVVRGWGRARSQSPGWSVVLLLVFLITFSGLDEYHQIWIPGRESEWRDWLADVSGILLGWSIGIWGLRRSLDRLQSSDTV